MTDESHVEAIPTSVPARRTCPGCGCLNWVVGALLLAVVVVWLLPVSVSVPHIAAERQMQCTNQIKQINLAILTYEQVHHCFPPAYVADGNGRPLYSWRVLILPYMEQSDLYKKIRLYEPWDSPHNRSVLQNGALAKLFQCPLAENPKDETSYVMIVGPNTISDGPHSVRYVDMKDGTSNTIMVAEIKNSGIHWAEPRDLNCEEMSFRVNDPNGKGISSYHRGVANVGLADGSVRSIADNIDPKFLKALTTINGGEDMSEFTK